MANILEGGLGAALEGVGTGLRQAIPALRETAREVRQEPLEALQFQQEQDQAAISHAKYQEWQEDQKTTPVADLQKEPLGSEMLTVAARRGVYDQRPDVPRYMKKAIVKDTMENPEIYVTPILNKRQETAAKVDSFKPELEKLQQELATLKPGIDDPKIQKTQQRLQELQSQQAPLVKELQMYSDRADEFRVLIADKQRAKMTANQLQVSDYLRTTQNKLGTLAEVEEYEQISKDTKKGTPYHAPLQTSSGFYSFDTRAGGSATPIIGSDGTPLKPISADVGLAGAKETATEEAKAAVEKKVAFPKARNTYASLNRQWDLVEKNVEKAINMVGPFTAGAGAWAKVIPATPQKNLSEVLDTIKANIGFDKLQDMRSNSPTGGALGQVSDFENRLLQAVQGSLVQSQSPAQLKENLRTVLDNLRDLRTEKKFAFNYDFKEFIKQPSGDAKKQEAEKSGEKAVSEMSDEELLNSL